MMMVLVNYLTPPLQWIGCKHKILTQYFWIGGFSFGAWVAMQLLMRRPEIMGFVSISPPANNYDFSFLAPCTASGLIVQGNKDTIVPEEYPAKLADKLAAQKNIEIDYNVIEEADHFFQRPARKN